MGERKQWWHVFGAFLFLTDICRQGQAQNSSTVLRVDRQTVRSDSDAFLSTRLIVPGTHSAEAVSCAAAGTLLPHFVLETPAADACFGTSAAYICTWPGPVHSKAVLTIAWGHHLWSKPHSESALANCSIYLASAYNNGCHMQDRLWLAFNDEDQPVAEAFARYQQRLNRSSVLVSRTFSGAACVSYRFNSTCKAAEPPIAYIADADAFMPFYYSTAGQKQYGGMGVAG